MKLIDVLVMISKGELKKGATFRDKEVGVTIGEFQLNEIPLTEKWLNEEYELIEPEEPDHFADDGKREEKIKELDISEMEIENFHDVEFIFTDIACKLNEVIRRINNERL